MNHIAVASLAAALGLAACGDLPQPFAGRPGRNALRLAMPPPPRLAVPAPAAALLPAQDAASWARAMTSALVAEEIPAFAEPAHKGDWQLALTATLGAGVVAPHFAVLDPKGATKGDIAGAPVPASLWAKADPAVLLQSAQAAAPQIVSLLRSVDASLKQSDPNSLYNRPARIYFTGVAGAPGDGNRSLARDMRTRLPDTGDQVVDQEAGADFTLKATVQVTDLPTGEQQVEIHWIVSGPRGALAGDVAQGKDIPKGSLDGHWGEIAAAITDEAAGGVRDVITNWSGRHHKAPPG